VQSQEEEMSFTDEDLKRLRELVKDQKSNIWLPVGEGHEKGIRVLLNRLEKAEICVDHLIHVHPDCKVVEAWRKAAGKS
jgi:hypothetical protein